jgi:hypothetical protein
MAETLKESFISASGSDIFDALKAEAPGLFGSKTFSDVKDFLNQVEVSPDKMLIRFNAEPDGSRQKYILIKARYTLVFDLLKAQFPSLFSGKVFNDVSDFFIIDPDVPGNYRIQFKEESGP